MPCACKKQKTLQKVQSVYVPSKRAFVPARLTSTYVNRLSLSDSQVTVNAQQESDSSKYDFSATVKADQLCLNCAMKHIALANVLMQSGLQQDICIASGQLLLAGAHYKEYSQDAATYCTALAHAVVRDIRQPVKWLPQLRTLMQYAIQPTPQMQPFWDVTTDPAGIQFLHAESGQYIAAVVNLSAAFSLLFTQVGYLQLNKAYAVGYIVRAVTLPIPAAGFMFGDYAPAQYNIKKARQAWKIVQEMQLNDDAYHECRKRLLTLIQRYANMYIMQKNELKAGRLVRKVNFVPRSRYQEMNDSQLYQQLRGIRAAHVHRPQITQTSDSVSFSSASDSAAS